MGGASGEDADRHRQRGLPDDGGEGEIDGVDFNSRRRHDDDDEEDGDGRASAAAPDEPAEGPQEAIAPGRPIPASPQV